VHVCARRSTLCHAINFNCAASDKRDCVATLKTTAVALSSPGASVWVLASASGNTGSLASAVGAHVDPRAIPAAVTGAAANADASATAGSSAGSSAGSNGELGVGWYTVQFASAVASGKFLHIGVPIEFVGGEEGPCWGTATPGGVDPRTIFEAQPFPTAEHPHGVSLKSLSSSKFLRIGEPGVTSSGPAWVVRAHDELAPHKSWGRFVLYKDRIFNTKLGGYLNYVSAVVRFHSARDPKERPAEKSEPTTEVRE